MEVCYDPLSVWAVIHGLELFTKVKKFNEAVRMQFSGPFQYWLLELSVVHS